MFPTFLTARVFSNGWSILSQYNTRLRLCHLLYDLDFTRAQQQNTLFNVLYSDLTWVFDQSERAQGPIYVGHICMNAHAAYKT